MLAALLIGMRNVTAQCLPFYGTVKSFESLDSEIPSCNKKILNLVSITDRQEHGRQKRSFSVQAIPRYQVRRFEGDRALVIIYATHLHNEWSAMSL